MGSYEKSTRAHLREVAGHWEDVGRRVSKDLAQALEHFEAQLSHRGKHLGETFIEIARERDAEAARIADLRRDLGRLRKRVRKPKEPRDLLRLHVEELADGVRRLRASFTTLRDRLEAARLAAPTSSHLIADLIGTLERAGPAWEQAARSVEDHHAELVDSGQPPGLGEIEREMIDSGMGHWLGDEDDERTPGALAELLRSKMHERDEVPSVDDMAHPERAPTGDGAPQSEPSGAESGG